MTEHGTPANATKAGTPPDTPASRRLRGLVERMRAIFPYRDPTIHLIARDLEEIAVELVDAAENRRKAEVEVDLERARQGRDLPGRMRRLAEDMEARITGFEEEVSQWD